MKSVLKRDNTFQPFDKAKIYGRLIKLTHGLHVDVTLIVGKVCDDATDGISSIVLDHLSARWAATFISLHPDYNIFASRILVSNLHKISPKKFSDFVLAHQDAGYGPKIVELVKGEHASEINNMIQHHRDYDYDYFGICTLIKTYLHKGIERPQFLLMRIALQLHGSDMVSVKKTYDMLASRVYTHATPTQFNAGMIVPQLSSCFLLVLKADSIDGIYETLHQCAKIAKYAGGIGLEVNDLRSKGMPISTTGGFSNGIVPFLQMFQSSALYVDQGGGKRKGSIAIYVEPWRVDIREILGTLKKTGNHATLANELFQGMWIPDKFMRAVYEKKLWHLFDPREAQGLNLVHGEEFDLLYDSYVEQGLARESPPALEIWTLMLESLLEVGLPYILFKDHVNKKSNQKNLGTIRSSNLCCEIMQYSSPEEHAVCNLSSICLPKFVREDLSFDYEALRQVAYDVTVNMNKVIDNGWLPTPEARVSNNKHRPLGVGVQGLADTFMMMRIPFEDAREENKKIFEYLYYGCCQASVDLAERDGWYESFPGSPASEGKFQFDLWDLPHEQLTLDWEPLRARMVKYGLRNSLLTALMPTASTAQIQGNYEGFEPLPSNIYKRNVNAGEHVVVNRYLVQDLIGLGLWSPEMKQRIINNRGSIQGLNDIPEDIQKLYKIVWEIKQLTVIKMAAERAPFIDQSQSMNLHLENANEAKLNTCLFTAWDLGLKTGCYYLRSRAVVEPQLLVAAPQEEEIGCLSCGS